MKYTYVIPKELAQANESGVDAKKIETHLTGTIDLDVPGFVGAAKISKEVRYKIGDDGKFVIRDQEEVMEAIMELVPKHITNIDAKSDDGLFVFNSFDDLGATLEGRQVLLDAMKVIMNGVQLGKN